MVNFQTYLCYICLEIRFRLFYQEFINLRYMVFFIKPVFIEHKSNDQIILKTLFIKFFIVFIANNFGVVLVNLMKFDISLW